MGFSIKRIFCLSVCYEKCNRFFNTGYCSLDKWRGCFRFPCGYKTKSESVRAILATLDKGPPQLALEYLFGIMTLAARVRLAVPAAFSMPPPA